MKTSYPVKDGDQSVDITDLVINLFTLQIWHFKRIISKRIMDELEKKAALSEDVEVNLSHKSALSLIFSWWICQWKQKKWSILRSELKTRRKHERAMRSSSLQATQWTAARSCLGSSRQLSFQAVYCFLYCWIILMNDQLYHLKSMILIFD